jgi:hypothetical protein
MDAKFHRRNNATIFRQTAINTAPLQQCRYYCSNTFPPRTTENFRPRDREIEKNRIEPIRIEPNQIASMLISR